VLESTNTNTRAAAAIILGSRLLACGSRPLPSPASVVAGGGLWNDQSTHGFVSNKTHKAEGTALGMECGWLCIALPSAMSKVRQYGVTHRRVPRGARVRGGLGFIAAGILAGSRSCDAPFPSHEACSTCSNS
jgi:hypothetical protein